LAGMCKINFRPEARLIIDDFPGSGPTKGAEVGSPKSLVSASVVGWLSIFAEPSSDKEDVSPREGNSAQDASPVPTTTAVRRVVIFLVTARPIRLIVCTCAPRYCSWAINGHAHPSTMLAQFYSRPRIHAVHSCW